MTDIDQLMLDINRYLAWVDLARSLGVAVTWR
jgi:hypothetical protein